MNDNVLPFIRNSGAPVATGETDPLLSRQLEGVYQGLYMNYSSSNVVTEPACPDYDAFIVPDGSMRLGMFGVIDFTERFSHTEVSPLGLYVGFMAYRHAFNVLIKEDNEFHAQMQAVAKFATSVMEEFRKKRDLHVVEHELLGRKAADITIQHQLGRLHKQRRDSERIKVKLAPQKHIRMGGSSDIKKARKVTLRHIGEEIHSDVDKKIDSALIAVLKKRSPQTSAIID